MLIYLSFIGRELSIPNGRERWHLAMEEVEEEEERSCFGALGGSVSPDPAAAQW